LGQGQGRLGNRGCGFQPQSLRGGSVDDQLQAQRANKRQSKERYKPDEQVSGSQTLQNHSLALFDVARFGML
jgi:hypothetical protein